MELTQEQAARLAARIERLSSCQTPEDVAYDIWTVELEEAIGSRQSYRDSFISWVISYKENTPPTQWKSYKTPVDVANAIWNSRYDMNETDFIWFSHLRETLASWIINHSKK